MIEFKREHVMNIIFNHVWFPVCQQAGIVPLKSKLYYDEKITVKERFSEVVSSWRSRSFRIITIILPECLQQGS